jgi:hypothetical protein
MTPRAIAKQRTKHKKLQYCRSGTYKRNLTDPGEGPATDGDCVDKISARRFRASGRVQQHVIKRRKKSLLTENVTWEVTTVDSE